MDFLQLKYFKKVAECKNMTAASHELMIAQPSVSKIIKKLENDIGYPVFDRKGRNITLNRNGEILLAYTNAIFNNIQSALDEISDHNMHQSQRVRIRLLSGSKLFPDIVSKFLGLYPECKLRVDQSNQLEKGDCDLTIYASTLPPHKEGNHVLLKEKTLLVVPTEHRLAKVKDVFLSDLSGEDFLALKKSLSFRMFTDSICAEAGFEPNIAFECDNPTFLREILTIGLGISFMPGITWGEISTPHTKAVELADGPFYRYINIAWDTNSYLHSAARAFRDFIISYYEALN